VLDHFIIGTPAQDQAPVVSVPATADVDEGGLLSLVVSAADADGDAILSLSADLSRLPAGNDAAFTSGPDHTSGVLTWHPTFADAGSHLVTFTASNALAGSAPTTVLVRQKDRPPVVSVPDTAFVVDEGSTLSIEALAEDPDADAVASLVMHILPEPAGVSPSFQPVPSFSNRISGTLLWVPDFADSGEYRVTFTAANSLAAHREVLVHVVDVDRSPFVIAPAALTVMGTGSLDFTVLASDPDGGAIESLVADLSQLPAGNSAVFSVAADHRSATFHWTPGASISGTYTLTFTAANARSGVTSTVLSVNHADHAPVVSAPDTVWVAEGALLRFGVSASDPDSTAIGGLSADLSGLPAGHGAQWNVTPDQRNLTFQWTAGFTHAGTYAVAWTATNALTGMRTTVVRVLQSDRPPIVTAPAAMTGSVGASVTIDVTAVDPDGDAVASLTADLTGLPAGHSAWFAVASDARSGTVPLDTRCRRHRQLPHRIPRRELDRRGGDHVAPDRTPEQRAHGEPQRHRFHRHRAAQRHRRRFGLERCRRADRLLPIRVRGWEPGRAAGLTGGVARLRSRRVAALRHRDRSVGSREHASGHDHRGGRGSWPNLCGNPSFEANTTGWNSFGSASYQRVPGGFSGTSAVELTGTGGTLSSFGLNDGPNWVGATVLSAHATGSVPGCDRRPAPGWSGSRFASTSMTSRSAPRRCPRRSRCPPMAARLGGPCEPGRRLGP
jgi:hypothetical protein